MSEFVPGFPKGAPCAPLTFFRTYARKKPNGEKESWEEVCNRVSKGLSKVGRYSEEETALVLEQMLRIQTTAAGRYLWTGGTPWIEKPHNVMGGYNCCSLQPTDWGYFNLLLRQLGMGVGVGFVLFPENTEKMPKIYKDVELKVLSPCGTETPEEDTTVTVTKNSDGNTVTVRVGDSLKGWADALEIVLHLYSDTYLNWRCELELDEPLSFNELVVDIRGVRKAGEPIKGFGGVASPSYLEKFFLQVSRILRKACGRKLKTVELAHIECEVAKLIVAGNIRRSALMIQFLFEDKEGGDLKDGLWNKDENGKWFIDPYFDSLKNANVTRVLRYKPSLEEVKQALVKQLHTGEGAIMWGGGALLRTNVDILNTPLKRQQFIEAYVKSEGKEYFVSLGESEYKAERRLSRLGLNPCVTGDTWVLTDEGPKQITDLIGKRHRTFVDNFPHHTTEEGFFSSGIQSVYRINTHGGHTIKATGNHRLLRLNSKKENNRVVSKPLEWIEVGELKPGDTLALNKHANVNWNGDSLKGLESPSIERVERSSYEDYITYLKPLISEGQFNEDTRYVIPIKSGTEEAIQRMLLRLGINSHRTTGCEINSLYIYPDCLQRLNEIFGTGIGNLYYPNYYESEHTYSAVVSTIEYLGSEEVYDCSVPGVNAYSANGFVSHNCGEIGGLNFMCNLSQVHLEMLDPDNKEEQERAFRAAALCVASLLHDKFVDDALQESREEDPIVAVTITGLFDFFVKTFGKDWLWWWSEGRPATPKGKEFKANEIAFLSWWRDIVEQTVWEYCDRHRLKRPSRVTAIQPSGSKSLLTGGNSAYYPPKSIYYWRNITVNRNSPEARACLEYGYQVLPSQSSVDENGVLIEDPFDERVLEWLVHVPCKVLWADLVEEGMKVGTLEGAPVESQWDLFQTVDTYFVTHFTSATVEFYESDIPKLSELIYEGIQDNSYVSFAAINREYNCFPNMPFCPMSKGEYEKEIARLEGLCEGKDLVQLIQKYQVLYNAPEEAPPPSCEGVKCEIGDIMPKEV